ncbi:MAG: hypothetical protein ACYC9P_00040 [Rudaea sp.]
MLLIAEQTHSSSKSSHIRQRSANPDDAPRHRFMNAFPVEIAQIDELKTEKYSTMDDNVVQQLTR